MLLQKYSLFLNGCHSALAVYSHSLAWHTYFTRSGDCVSVCVCASERASVRTDGMPCVCLILILRLLITSFWHCIYDPIYFICLILCSRIFISALNRRCDVLTFSISRANRYSIRRVAGQGLAAQHKYDYIDYLLAMRATWIYIAARVQMTSCDELTTMSVSVFIVVDVAVPYLPLEIFFSILFGFGFPTKKFCSFAATLLWTYRGEFGGWVKNIMKSEANV